MAAISQSVPTLLGGVSQQPDPIKLPGQVRQADNVYLDPTFGCVKRPPTRYVASCGKDIPEGAKWFSIFRDNNERYLCCVYSDPQKNPKTRFRVFEADSGIERNVTYAPGVGDYIDPGSFKNLEFLTINDYTFIANPRVTVTASEGLSAKTDEVALVVINQVGYNTTYSVDLLGEDEELEQVKKYTATGLTVSPGNFEVENDEGACNLAGTQEFTESNGLKYRLTVNCQPVQVTEYEDGEPYPTQVQMTMTTDQQFADWAAVEFGSPLDVALNSYAYTQKTLEADGKDLIVRIEARCVKICTYGETSDGSDKNRVKWVLSSADVVSYDSGGNDKRKWKKGVNGSITIEAVHEVKAGYSDSGFDACDDRHKEVQEGQKCTIRFEVSGIDKGPRVPVYSYKSSYSASIQLLQGGIDVKKGDEFTATLNGQLYKIRVKSQGITYAYESEASVTYTTPSDITSGPLDVGTIAGALIAEIEELDKYSCEGIGNVIKITRDNGKKFNISARGGSTDSAMYAIKDTVNDISKLPTTGYPDILLKVQNSIDAEADDYYVKFVTSGGIPGAGSWEETVKTGIQTSFNASTMPHALKRRANGDFKVINLEGTDADDIIAWADRDVGDEDTNPMPTFVGQRITNMVFHMNRFGFLSEDTVVLSQPGDYFNFFVGSAIAVSDADPIDMAATSTRPASLTRGISTPQGLLLFSSDAQFLMGTRDVAFGPSTVQINEVSNYSYSSTVAPIEVGTSIFFASNSTNFSKVFEMSTKSISETPQVAEDTRIVPEYVPNNLVWGAASSNNNLALFGTQNSDVYCFKYWNQGDERSLAGWFRWRFAHDVQLMAFADDVAYGVFYNQTTGHTIISTMNLMDDPDVASIWSDDRSFEPRLDHYAPKGSLTVTQEDDDTKRIDLPEGTYAGQELAYLQFSKSSGTYFTAVPIQFDNNNNFNGAHVLVSEDTLQGTKDYNLGIAYNMVIELPSFYVKDEKRVDRVNLPMIETVNIELYLSGSYTVKLEKLGYQDRTLYFDAKVSDVYRADRSPIIETSKKELAVFSRGDHAAVTIYSLDPLPAGITGYTWEGHYSNRGITTL
jgi:phosphoheptose isomerase